MKFFIASSWRNKEMVKQLTEGIITRGHTTYSFFNNGANLLGGASMVEESEEAEENFPNSISNWEDNPAVKEIFESDMKALKESDMVILLEPSGRSSLAEAGIAFGMGKEIVLVGLVAHPEIVVYCICEHRYPTIEEFLASLNKPV